MGWSPSSPWTVLVVLVAVLTAVLSQSSPCGPSVLNMSVNEYPGQPGFTVLSLTERPNYKSRIIDIDTTAVSQDLESVTIALDEANRPPAGLDDVATTLRLNNVVDFGTGRIVGYEAEFLKGIDRDGATPSTDDDLNSVQYRIVCRVSTSEAYFHSLKVQINDLNDNKPQFSGLPYAVSVSELTPTGVIVFGGISSTDLDNNNNRLVNYAVSTATTSQFDATGMFVLGSKPGEILLSRPLDYESMISQVGSPADTVFILNVTAYDSPTAASGDPVQSNWTTLSVTITDGDDLGPVFLYDSCVDHPQRECVTPAYDATIQSGQTQNPGTYLQLLPIPRLAVSTQTVDILVRDGDRLNASISCFIVSTEPSGYESSFEVIPTQVNASSNVYRCNVRVRNALLRTNTPELRVTVGATEQPVANNFPNRYTYYANVYIAVTPTNQFAPQLDPTALEGYILENSLPGTLVKENQTLNTVLRLRITDQDVGPGDGIPRYRITLDVFPVKFVVGDVVGSEAFVRVASPVLDYETTSQYTLTATVEELSTTNPLSSTATLTIYLLDVNDNAPRVLDGNALRRVDVPERDYTSQFGQTLVIFGSLMADWDSGLNAQLDYNISSVVAPAGKPSNIFVINPSNVLVLNGSVVSPDQYTVQTEVTDRGKPAQRTRVTVVVNIVPAGNQAPQFPSDQFTIFVSESMPTGRSVWLVPATDPENDALTLTIVSSVPAANVFSINSENELTTAAALDREQVPVYTLVIRATETVGGKSASATVTVSILDANDRAPEFLQQTYTFSIDENSPAVSSVGTVSANDGDAPNTPSSTITYSIQPASSDFQIDPASGQINSRRSFDYEVRRQYVLLVRATDGGPNNLVGVAQVTVNINDLGDNVPRFVQGSYTFFVDEQQPIATSVGTVQATDLDATQNTQFQFVSGQSGSDFFTINAVTGLITTRVQLNYQTDPRYQFVVTTTDGATSGLPSASATVTVIVREVNNLHAVSTTSTTGKTQGNLFNIKNVNFLLWGTLTKE